MVHNETPAADGATSDPTAASPTVLTPEQRIEEFKRRLATRLCLELLAVPIPPVPALRIPSDATRMCIVAYN